jgi:REP element-mobilizing transposase RayT
VLSRNLQLRPHPFRYRRNLPHIQRADAPTFFTFATLERESLSSAERKIVLGACLHWDGKKIEVYAAVVMPDHVHLLCDFYRNESGELIPFREVLGSIKGFSAYQINRLNAARGSIWQDESFDRVMRVHDDLRTKVEYVIHNPVRWNLVTQTVSVALRLSVLHSLERLCHKKP